MKTIFSLFILMVIILPSFSQEKSGRAVVEGKHGKEGNIETLLNSRSFVFRARRVSPAGMGSIDLTTNPNYVKFEPDLIESHMPFFGRAYSGIGYGDDQGLHFSGQPAIYEIQRRKKEFIVRTTVKGERDNYRLLLSVSPGGNATLTINSNNRETITYVGDIGEK